MLAIQTLWCSLASLLISSGANGVSLSEVSGSGCYPGDGSSTTHVQTRIRNGDTASKGVNLGGWLVTERWMTYDESFWAGVSEDVGNLGEYSTITSSADPAAMRTAIAEHHATYITEEDIRQISAAGINTVRVPVGWWIAGFDNHANATENELGAYPENTIQYLDTLIEDWAVTHNVAVLVDIHAAKGSQNGADHSSPIRPGEADWSSNSDNVASTLEAVEFLAARYKSQAAFLGIGLLNEPNGATNKDTLYQYYEDAYAAIRGEGNDCVLVVAPLLYEQSPDAMVDFMSAPDYKNVWVEWHPYFVWGYENTTASDLINVAIKQNFQTSVSEWNARANHNRLFLGEWSLATGSGQFDDDTDGLHEYASAQVGVMNQAGGGWTYWTWKVTNDTGRFEAWSLRSALADTTLFTILTE